VHDGVGRQQRRDVDVEVEDVLHGARVLGAVEALEGAAAGVRRARRRGVDLLLEGRRSGVMLESARIIASVAVGIALCVTTWLWAWFPVVLFTGVASMIHLAVLFKENTEAA
jgi:hypothetical protein